MDIEKILMQLTKITKLALISDLTRFSIEELQSWNESKLEHYETVLLRNSRNAMLN